MGRKGNLPLMDTTRIQIIQRPLEAVQFTEENAEAVRQWVQDNTMWTEIVCKNGRLYLPVNKGRELDIVLFGEYVVFDPDSKDFTSMTAEAYHEFYEEVVG